MPDERARIGIFGLAGIEGWGHAADAAKTKAKDVDDTHNTHISTACLLVRRMKNLELYVATW